MMEYKGYTAKVEFDVEAEIFHGEVIGIKDVVTFQGKPRSLRRSSGNQWTIIFLFVRSGARTPQLTATNYFIPFENFY